MCYQLRCYDEGGMLKVAGQQPELLFEAVLFWGGFRSDFVVPVPVDRFWWEVGLAESLLALHAPAPRLLRRLSVQNRVGGWVGGFRLSGRERERRVPSCPGSGYVA